jgi:hypothetical protein
LGFVKASNIADGSLEGCALFLAERTFGGGKLRGTDFERLQIDAIEAAGKFEHRPIAASANVLDDFGHASMQAVGIRLRRPPQGSAPLIRGKTRPLQQRKTHNRPLMFDGEPKARR